jgi:tRNA-uridine 2-sulfurtransferase
MKDQSYALYMLGQRELAALELPIGELEDKAETRALAARFGLPNAAKAESMDICFIGGDYRDFVRERAPEAFAAGPIERLDGTAIGTHAGVGGLTVGQRSGVGLATGERLYVLRLEPERGAVIVGRRDEIATRTYGLRDLAFTADAAPADIFTADAVLRYRGTPLAAEVRMSMDRGSATLQLAQPALVAPGQAAVLYRDDEVIGGGVVDRPLPD